MLRLILSILLVGAILGGCTTAQEQQAATITKTALQAAQAACQGAAQARALAQATAKGGALNTVNTIASYVDATCQASALAQAVANDPATAAWISGLGTALVAASSAKTASN